MREMLAEADRSGTGRVGAHVEKAPPWRSRASGRGCPTHTRKHAPPLRRPSQHVAVADGVAHFTPFNIQVGPDDFVHIVTSYAHHYDGLVSATRSLERGAPPPHKQTGELVV